MAEAFISYTREDSSTAEAIAQQLEQLGVDVWWDPELIGGDDFRGKITAILERADVAIVIWSRRSVESRWVINEAMVASEKNTIVPVSIDGHQVPIDFRSMHVTDLKSWLPGERLPEALINTLAFKLGRELTYATQAAPASAATRLAKQATAAWYIDVESMFFYLIGQGFACSLVNIPIAAMAKDLPLWAPYLLALLNGIIVVALYLKPALATRRMKIAVPLMVLGTALSIPAFIATSWLLRHTSTDQFLVIVGFCCSSPKSPGAPIPIDGERPGERPPISNFRAFSIARTSS